MHPNRSIQDGKKPFSGLRSVFIEIRGNKCCDWIFGGLRLRHYDVTVAPQKREQSRGGSIPPFRTKYMAFVSNKIPRPFSPVPKLCQNDEANGTEPSVVMFCSLEVWRGAFPAIIVLMKAAQLHESRRQMPCRNSSLCFVERSARSAGVHPVRSRATRTAVSGQCINEARGLSHLGLLGGHTKTRHCSQFRDALRRTSAAVHSFRYVQIYGPRGGNKRDTEGLFGMGWEFE
jgi:hypothetical protein